MDGHTIHDCPAKKEKQHQKTKDSNKTTTTSSTTVDSSTEALLRLILLEQRNNFEKIDSTLTKLNNTLDTLSTVVASIYEELQE